MRNDQFYFDIKFLQFCYKRNKLIRVIKTSVIISMLKRDSCFENTVAPVKADIGIFT